jgi:hypothetical protein
MVATFWDTEDVRVPEQHPPSKLVETREMLKRLAALSLAGLLLFLTPVQANAGLLRKFLGAGAAVEGAEAFEIGASFAALLTAAATATQGSPQYQEAVRRIESLLAQHPHIGPTILGHEASKLAARSPSQAAAVRGAELQALSDHRAAVLESRRGDDSGGQGGYSRGQLRAMAGGVGGPDDDDDGGDYRFRKQNRGDQSTNRRAGDSKRAEQDAVDQAAKLERVSDRDGFGRFLEEEKAAEGRPNNYNFSMQDLRTLARQFKAIKGQ